MNRWQWAAVWLAALLASPARGQDADPAATRLDRAALDRELKAVADAHPGLAVSVWLGGAGPAWYERDADCPRPTASAVKAFFLVELFAAHAGALDKPLPGAEAVLADDTHPAVSHFDAAHRADIRKALAGASVRRVGAVMIGTAPASNHVYNAAANLVTATLGGPEALTKLIHKRHPAFTAVAVRRYMLRDRKTPGDNEAPAAALAALHGLLATGKVPNLDAATAAAVTDTLRVSRTGSEATHFAKDGALGSDPATEVRAGWWETPTGPVVYVVMAVQPAPAKAPLAKVATDLATKLAAAGRAARGADK